MLIDTHAHLNFEDYPDLDSVIERSLLSGVKKIVCVSSNIADSILTIKIAKKYSGIVYAAIGIHPQCTDPQNKNSITTQLKQLEELILANKELIIAIGECGLDFTSVLENERARDLREQEELFGGQIELAKKHNLPLLLHLNKAHDYFLETHQELKKWKGIFHCYVGGKKRLKKFLEFENFMFGVTGLITYDEGLQQVIKEIPPERIVLETDYPFLAPLPHRGERNDPSNILLIAEQVAKLREVKILDVARQTTKNVAKILGI